MESGKNLSFGKRLRFAIAGLAHGLSSERSVRTQVFCFVLVLIGMAILRPAPIWFALVLLASAAVVAAELFNTAVEHLADHLHPELHPSIRIVKDCAAAGVLVAVLGAIGVAGALIFELCRK
jgi:diacylglycerol kinase (ATP)